MSEYVINPVCDGGKKNKAMKVKFTRIDKRSPVLITLGVVLCLILTPGSSGLGAYEYTISMHGRVGSPALSQLHVNGKYILDESGNKVFLRGINTPSLEFFELGGPYIRVEENWATLRDVFHANIVRLPFNMEWYLGRETYRQIIDEIINLAEEHGIYILLNMHYTDSTNQIYALPPDVDAWIAMWVNIAQRYLGRTNLLFDIYNEPHPSVDADWVNMAQNCVNAIRAVDPDRIIVVSATRSGNGNMNWVQTTPITGGNIVYTLHWYIRYTPEVDPPYHIEDIKAWLERYGWKWILDNNVAPMIVGEVGIYKSEPEHADWLRNFFAVMNEWEQGYTGFCFYPNMESSMVDDDWKTPNLAGNILIDAINA